MDTKIYIGKFNQFKIGYDGFFKLQNLGNVRVFGGCDLRIISGFIVLGIQMYVSKLALAVLSVPLGPFRLTFSYVIKSS